MNCDLSDLPIEQCACRLHGPKETPPQEMRTLAKFDGECLECHEDITAGVDLLQFSPYSGWVHQECTG